MKKVFFLTILFLSLVACEKKDEKTPEGPTDVRLYNVTDVDFHNLSVTMSDTTVVFGDLPAKGTTEYSRFPKAFPKAEINCYINDIKYSTGAIPDIYMQTLGRAQVTYEIYVSDDINKVLAISNVILDEPLIIE